MSKSRGRSRERRPPARRPARKPVWQRKTCGECGDPCILAEEDTGGGRLKGALVAGSPAPGGILVRTGGGVLVRDPEFRLPGTRYAWHHCPVRNG